MPGNEPPMSSTCAVTAAKPRSSPSWKIGTAIATSGECEAPRYGWLWTITSPSSISPLEPVEEAADVPGQRADVHRRRVRLADLAALRVEDAGAEVLRLADDRGVAHPEQDAGHLLRDRVERAAEHAQRDRVDLDALAGRAAGLAADLVLHTTSLIPLARRGSGSVRRALAPRPRTPTSMTMLPKRSTCAETPGGITVVESYWLTIAGPSTRLPALSAARS